MAKTSTLKFAPTEGFWKQRGNVDINPLQPLIDVMKQVTSFGVWLWIWTQHKLCVKFCHFRRVFRSLARQEKAKMTKAKGPVSLQQQLAATVRDGLNGHIRLLLVILLPSASGELRTKSFIPGSLFFSI